MKLSNEDNIKKILGERLTQERKKKGLSRNKIAGMLHVSVSSYGYYERGTQSPSLQTICDLSDILKVSTDYLLGISNYPSHAYDAREKTSFLYGDPIYTHNHALHTLLRNIPFLHTNSNYFVNTLGILETINSSILRFKSDKYLTELSNITWEEKSKKYFNNGEVKREAFMDKLFEDLSALSKEEKCKILLLFLTYTANDDVHIMEALLGFILSADDMFDMLFKNIFTGVKEEHCLLMYDLLNDEEFKTINFTSKNYESFLNESEEAYKVE